MSGSLGGGECLGEGEWTGRAIGLGSDSEDDEASSDWLLGRAEFPVRASRATTVASASSVWP
ncbi:MAG: hypothetical protein ACK44Q_02990, partial [Pirellulaceae bacterium]